MQVVESFRYVGIFASLVAWLAIVVALYKNPIEKSKSISKHVSVSKQTWLLFAPIETIALVLFYVFMFKWLIPVLALPLAFKVLITLALLLELVTTWVPDTTGIKRRIHHYTAYGAALSIPVFTLFLATSSYSPIVAKVVAYLATAVALFIIFLFIVSKEVREKHLIYHSVYFACFHIPILAAIFCLK